MKYETIEMLKNINEQYNIEFGKICQKLLALSCKRAGFDKIVEREVQGVDIDASNNAGIKYAIEVKTTTDDSINIADKDIKGLADRQKDGYKPLLAALRIDALEDWIFAEAEYLNKGNNLVSYLEIYNLPELQQLIAPYFDEVVKEHYYSLLNNSNNKPLEYLKKELEKSGITEVDQS